MSTLIGWQTYEAGALVVALLAHPEENEGEAFRGTFNSLCALTLRLRAATDIQWALNWQSIRPVHAFVAEQKIERTFRTVRHRLNQRVISAQMLMPFLMEASTGTVPALPPGPGRALSINRVAALACENNGLSNAENVESRIWRPSLPVIHVAAAIELLGSGLRRPGYRPFNFWDLFVSRSVIARVIISAQEIEELIPRSRRLRIPPDRLIRLRLAGK